jgi:hypothetical protein
MKCDQAVSKLARGFVIEERKSSALAGTQSTTGVQAVPPGKSHQPSLFWMDHDDEKKKEKRNAWVKLLSYFFEPWYKSKKA